MRYLKFTTVAVLMLIFTVFTTGAAQTPQAVIVVEAVSVNDIHEGNIDTSKYHSPSTGLKTVGKGEIVYL
ncbi:MAG: hypothetical protein ACE5NG_02795, partial [bacterium]